RARAGRFRGREASGRRRSGAGTLPRRGGSPRVAAARAARRSRDPRAHGAADRTGRALGGAERARRHRRWRVIGGKVRSTRPRYIAVEGPIGAGKSSLAEILGEARWA